MVVAFISAATTPIPTNLLAFATEVLYNVSPIYPETFMINAEVCSLLYVLFIIAILLFIWLQISTILQF